jgi:CheY-like chemotaxis protein
MNKSPCKVLVVDDERSRADSNVSMLQLWGHEAEAAYSAEDAIAKATALDPDVVLMDMDIETPLIDGFDLVKELRTSCPEAKLLALTGYTEADIVRRARRAGFERVLNKPAPAKAIKEAVEAGCAAAPAE